MTRMSLRRALPYGVGLLVAAALYASADHIAYTPRPGELGPDFWPKLAIGLMAVVCVVEIIRVLIGTSAAGAVSEPSVAAGEGEAPAPSWRLLIGGVAVVVAYAVVVPILGFLLATMVFMAAFMYVGRYRNHLAIWGVSVIATVLIGLLFLRFAYVSLPRGAPPFDRFTDFIRIVLGG